MSISDYNKTKPLDVQSVSGTPTVDKTQPLIIVDGDDSTTGTGDIVIDFANISDAQDIAVYDQNDNLLDYEIEDLDTNNNTAVLWAYNSWVRDGSTQAKIAYGNNSANTDRQNVTATWGNTSQDTRFVHHFEESSTPFLDSTSNDNDSTSVTGTSQVSGQYGDGRDLDGSDDEIEIGHSSSMSTGNTGAVCFWVNIDSYSIDIESFAYKNTTGNDNGDYAVRRRNDIQTDGMRFFAQDGSNTVTVLADQPATNTWVFVQAELNSNQELEIYKDGVLQNTSSSSLNSTVDFGANSSAAFQISDDDQSGRIDGQVDEYRLYGENKGAEWGVAEYDASPTGGQTFFSQQAATTGGQTIATPETQLTQTTPNPSLNITAAPQTINVPLDFLPVDDFTGSSELGWESENYVSIDTNDKIDGDTLFFDAKTADDNGANQLQVSRSLNNGSLKAGDTAETKLRTEDRPDPHDVRWILKSGSTEVMKVRFRSDSLGAQNIFVNGNTTGIGSVPDDENISVELTRLNDGTCDYKINAPSFSETTGNENLLNDLEPDTIEVFVALDETGFSGNTIDYQTKLYFDDMTYDASLTEQSLTASTPNPSLSATATITTTKTTNTVSNPSPSVSPGAVTVSTPVTVNTVSTPSFSIQGALTVSTPATVNTVSTPSLALNPGSVSASITTTTNTVSTPSPGVSAGSATVSVSTSTSTVTTPAFAIEQGQVIGITTSTNTATTPSPTLSAGATTVQVSETQLTQSTPSPQLDTQVTIGTPVTVNTVSTPSPGVSAGTATVTVTTTTNTVSNPSPTLRAFQTIQTPTTTNTATTPSPTLSAGDTTLQVDTTTVTLTTPDIDLQRRVTTRDQSQELNIDKTIDIDVSGDITI